MAARTEAPVAQSKKARMKQAASSVLGRLLKAVWADHTELRLLITGKTGEGKSTLVNGILGEDVAVEGAGSIRCTAKVEEFKRMIQDVPVTVFDSPGLQDNTENEDEYLKQMQERCKMLSLVLYCTKMTSPRLKDEDKNAIRKLTEAFGEEFWKFSVLVLTFANKEDVSRRDERDEDTEPEPDLDDDKAWEELGRRRFEGRLKKWKHNIYTFLIKEIGVNEGIVTRIPVIPTGDHKISRENREPLWLPDREDWFVEFWKVCCLRVKETGLFLKINSHRIIAEEAEGEAEGEVEAEGEGEAEAEATEAITDLEGIVEQNDSQNLSLDEYEHEGTEIESGTSTNLTLQFAVNITTNQGQPVTVNNVAVVQVSLKQYINTLMHFVQTRNGEIDLRQQRIPITEDFVSDVVQETLLRRFGKAAKVAAKAVLKVITFPVKWLISSS